MTTLATMLAAAQRLLTYYNGDEKTAQNPGGLTGVGGMADNWDPCIQDIGTVANGVGDAMTAASTSEGNAGESAEAAAESALSAQQDAQATAADRQATGQDRQATAADRQAVAQDRTAVEGSASAAATSATLSGQYAAAAGGSIPSVRLTWDTGTADADPGNGKLRLNNATVTAATALYVDNLDTAGASITTVLDRWTASTNTTKGTLRIAHRTDATKWVEYQVTGTVVDGTGYRKITLTGGAGPGGFAAGDPVAVGFSRAGDMPSSFSAGTAAAPGWAVTGDADTGIAQIGGADTLSVVTGGAERVRWGSGTSLIKGTWLKIQDAADSVIGMLGPTGAGTSVVGTFSNHDAEMRAGNLLALLVKYVAGAARWLIVTPSAGGNVKVSTNAGGLDVNAADGSTVNVGGGQTGASPAAVNIPETGHATSRRASLQMGSWVLNQDTSATGARDFGLYSGAIAGLVFLIDATLGVWTFMRAVVAKPVNLSNVSGTVTLDLSLGNRFDMVLVGNVILANPTNGTPGQTVIINAKQDGTGGRTISVGTYFKTKSAAGITLSTAANARDKIVLEQYSATEVDTAIGKDWR